MSDSLICSPYPYVKKRSICSHKLVDKDNLHYIQIFLALSIFGQFQCDQSTCFGLDILCHFVLILPFFSLIKNTLIYIEIFLLLHNLDNFGQF